MSFARLKPLGAIPDCAGKNGLRRSPGAPEPRMLAKPWPEAESGLRGLPSLSAVGQSNQS